MNRNRILKVACLAAAAAAGSGLAQGTTISTITYDMVQLQTKPQTVEIYQNLMTPIFFDDTIVEVLTGNPDLFSVEVNQTKTALYMRAKQPVGMTDMYVTTANGMTVMLIINAKPTGFAPKRIEIKLPRDAFGNVRVEGSVNMGYPQTQPSATPAPQVSYPSLPYPTPTYPAPGYAPSYYQPYAPTAPYPYYPYYPYAPYNPGVLVPQGQPSYPLSTQGTGYGPVSSAPTYSLPVTPAPAPSVPASVAAAPVAPAAQPSDQPTLTTRAQLQGGSLEVSYGLRAGAAPVAFKPQDLRVTSAGKAVRYRIIREGGTDARTIAPGEEDQGTIIIDGAASMGDVQIRWAIQNGTLNQTFTRNFTPSKM